MLAEALREAQDGIGADLTQPRRGPDAAAVGEVLGDGHEFVLGRPQAEQGGVRTDAGWKSHQLPHP
jgi:hypothetical protein